MDFSNARVLGYNRVNNFFDSDFRFGVNTSYSIEGYLLDLGNTIGVSGVLEASEVFRTGLQDYQDININGEGFGKGRVSNFAVQESNFIQFTTYSLDINGFDTGNLYNLSGDYYNGLNELTGQLSASYLLEEFEEDFNFSRGDDSYSYTHSVNIKYVSGDNILISPLDRARALATYIMTGSAPSFGFIDNQTSGLYTGNYKEYYSESLDQINNTYSVTKTFNSFNPSGDYGITLKHSYNRDARGITNVTEDAGIKVHTEPKRTALVSAIELEILDSYDRCSDIFDAYSSSTPLFTSPQSVGKNINNFNGEGGYSVVFTNDPAFNNTYTWVYTHQIDKNGAFFVVSENGEIQGLGSSSQDKYAAAIAGYATVKAGINSRVNAFFNGGTLYLTVQSESKNEFNGTVGYGKEFTDDPSHSDGGLKRLEISVEDTIPVDMVNIFGILGHKEIVQSAGTTTLGQRNLSMNMFGLRTSDLNSLLSIADSTVNSHIPDGNDVYISDAKYGYNDGEKSVNLNVVWNFNRVDRETEQV